MKKIDNSYTELPSSVKMTLENSAIKFEFENINDTALTLLADVVADIKDTQFAQVLLYDLHKYLESIGEEKRFEKFVVLVMTSYQVKNTDSSEPLVKPRMFGIGKVQQGGR